MTTSELSASALEAAPQNSSKSGDAYLLIGPAVVWMTLFLVVPMAMIVYVSFWTQTTFKIESTLTLASWRTFFSSDTYLSSLWTTIRIWLIVLAATFFVGYPTALFVGLFVKNKTLQTTLLVLCVIPFWTSFLIRVRGVAAHARQRGRDQYHPDEGGHHPPADRGAAVHRSLGRDRHDADLCRVHGRADRLHARPHRSEYSRSRPRSRRRASGGCYARSSSH